MAVLEEGYQLSNGVILPPIGYGMNLLDEDIAEKRIYDAVMMGYRLIDTAPVYHTESCVGKAIKKAEADGIKRGDIMVQSKLANEDQGYYSALEAFDRSLNELCLEYVDVYLIHWPVPRGREHEYKELNIQSWQAMEELYRKKRVHVIGVSNFLPRHIKNIMEAAEISPMVNQVEFHPEFQGGGR